MYYIHGKSAGLNRKQYTKDKARRWRYANKERKRAYDHWYNRIGRAGNPKRFTWDEAAQRQVA